MSKAFLELQIMSFDQKGPQRIRNHVRLLPDVVSEGFHGCMGKRVAGKAGARPGMGRSGAVVLNTGVAGSPVDLSDVGPRGVSLPGLGPITSPTLDTGYGFLQLQPGNNPGAGT